MINLTDISITSISKDDVVCTHSFQLSLSRVATYKFDRYDQCVEQFPLSDNQIKLIASSVLTAVSYQSYLQDVSNQLSPKQAFIDGLINDTLLQPIIKAILTSNLGEQQ